MKTTLTLGPGLELPLSTVSQKLAFIAISGGGKTYTATKLAEEMWRANCQFVAIDPVGVWYGLRLQEDGKTKSDIDIPVFGGLHGDIPLQAEHGPMLAGLVATKGLRCILDVSIMRKGDRKRFVASFCEELFHLKKTHRGPLHVFFEEAQFFAPQMSGGRGEQGEIADLIGAMQDLCCVGRNFGIGHSLISQRPQSVQKSILNQAQALFVFQTSGSQERKAIADWASECGLKSADVNLDLLPTLETGQAVLWSPKWLRRMDKVLIAKKTTYDASSTPEWTEQVTLQPIDLVALGEEMKQVVEEAAASDPKVLRKRVQELEAQLATRGGCAVDIDAPTGLVHKDLYDQLQRDLDARTEERDALDRTISRKNETIAKLRDKAANLKLVLGGAATELGDAEEIAKDSLFPEDEPDPESLPSEPADDSPTTGDSGPLMPLPPSRLLGEPHRVSEATKLPGGARRMLEALATHPQGLTAPQFRMLSELKESGTFDKYKSILRTSSYMAQEGGLFKPTAQGIRAARSMGVDVSKPRSVNELLAKWRATIDGSGKKMFDVIVKHGSRGITRVALALKAEITQSGTFDKYLSQIRSTGCFEFGRGREAVIRVRQDLHTLCGN